MLLRYSLFTIHLKIDFFHVSTHKTIVDLECGTGPIFFLTGLMKARYTLLQHSICAQTKPLGMRPFGFDRRPTVPKLGQEIGASPKGHPHTNCTLEWQSIYYGCIL